MATTTLTILGDARGARRALGDVRAEHARATAAMGADDQRAQRARARAEAEEITFARRQLRAMQNARQRAARERQMSEARERKARATVARQEAAAQQQAARAASAAYAKAEADKTRAAERESRRREREAAREASARRREEERVTRDLEKEVRKRQTLLRAMNERATRPPRGRPTSNTGGGNGDGNGSGGGGAGGRSSGRGNRFNRAVDSAENAAGHVGAFAGNVLDRRRGMESVDERAVQIAAGDIGDVRAAPQLLSATRRVSLDTGIDPADVMDTLGKAQANFSNLADAAGRASYLGTVFPALGRTAVATNSSLEDVVNSSGELSRQFGIANENLPRANAMVIQTGRAGSIGFNDTAAHLGTLGGAATRFLRGDGSNQRASMESLATTSALFQFAGRAGGSGDEAATRAQAFLSNMTSGRGQRALRGVLGRDAFDATGQLRTKQGETQSAAFRRTIEEVYRRTGGNSTRFLDAAAGANVRSRALGDQLFKDLQRNKGRLTEFSGMVNEGLGASVESTINRPFQAITNTAAATRRRNDVQRAYGSNEGGTSAFFGAIEDRYNAWSAEHPLLDLGARAVGLTGAGSLLKSGAEAIRNRGGVAGVARSAMGALGRVGVGAAGASLAGVGAGLAAFFHTTPLSEADAAAAAAGDNRGGSDAAAIAAYHRRGGTVQQRLAAASAATGGGGSGGGGEKAMREAVAQGVVDGLARATINANVSPHDAETAAARQRSSRGAD